MYRVRRGDDGWSEKDHEDVVILIANSYYISYIILENKTTSLNAKTVQLLKIENKQRSLQDAIVERNLLPVALSLQNFDSFSNSCFHSSSI